MATKQALSYNPKVVKKKIAAKLAKGITISPPDNYRDYRDTIII